MKQITGHTGLTGLFGSPVAHSISPMMHNASFEHLGLDYVYLAFDVGTDKLAAAVDGLRAMNVRGFNLTMPDKNKMCELCDRLSPAAEISQAVNTVVNDNGILTGHTTDGTGYLLAAKDAGYDLIGKKMTLLGAGGAATSILVQAALDGLSEISVFSIHDQFYVRAEQIVQTLNERTNCKVQLFDFEDDSILRREIADSYILTNGTSVGMAPAMIMAFSSASSVGALPLNLECAEKLGARKEVASFVLPLGATINMDGTAIYQGVCAVFIASCYGINLTLSQQIVIILTAVLASVGTAGVPGSGMIMLAMVLQSVGLPVEGIALVAGIDRLFDMGRTTVNITGDAACAVIVSHLEDKRLKKA